MDDYLTLQEAADLLGVSRWTIWRRVRAGELQAYTARVDRRTRLVKRADAEALMHPQPIADDRKDELPPREALGGRARSMGQASVAPEEV
jgi:excisionase family DNA binding protein